MKKNYEMALAALKTFHENNLDVFDANGAWMGERMWIQPSESLTKVTWKYVYLSNINGLIAKYNRQTGEVII